MTGRHLSPNPSTLTREEFLRLYGGIYEHSEWIAAACFDAGLAADSAQPEVLARAMARVVEAAGLARQLALLRAHPELAGKLAIGTELTRESRSEQASAGLNQCTPEEFSRFQELNEAYNRRFGFPFIIAVGGLDRREILAAFEERILHDREAEFREALDQVHRIALLRLSAMATK